MEKISLYEKYPASMPCSCDICLSYCKRPGWWTVEQAKNAINAGYANRMMIEMSPSLEFGVLSPAFKGCEGNIATKLFENNGCNFLRKGLCVLHGTEHMPLECGYCHHERAGMGEKCHLDLEKDWKSKEGQQLVLYWLRLVGLIYTAN